LSALNDVVGLRVGNADDHRLRSGITAVLFDQPTVAAVDVRGGGPSSRETDLLAPENTMQTIDGLAAKRVLQQNRHYPELHCGATSRLLLKVLRTRNDCAEFVSP
jgi:hypothetical protein